MPLSLDLADVAEFRTPRNEHGRGGAIRVALADLPTLADHLDRRLGLPGDGTVVQRLRAALDAFIRDGEVPRRYRADHHHLAMRCVRAGLAYELRWFDGHRW